MRGKKWAGNEIKKRSVVCERECVCEELIYEKVCCMGEGKSRLGMNLRKGLVYVRRNKCVRNELEWVRHEREKGCEKEGRGLQELCKREYDEKNGRNKFISCRDFTSEL